jgi:hypothetical protein
LLFGEGLEKTLQLGFRLEGAQPLFGWSTGMAGNRAGRDRRGKNENRDSHGFTVRRSIRFRHQRRANGRGVILDVATTAGTWR